MVIGVGDLEDRLYNLMLSKQDTPSGLVITPNEITEIQSALYALPDRTTRRWMHAAAMSGSVDLCAVVNAATNGLLLLTQDEDGSTPLHIAACHNRYHRGRLPLVRWFLEEARAPLMTVAITIHSRVRPAFTVAMSLLSNMLIYDEKFFTFDVFTYICQNAPALVNQPDGRGDLPLHFACRVEMWDAVRVLLENGADVHRLNPRCGRTALNSAIAMRPTNVGRIMPRQVFVMLISEYGADPSACDADGDNSLHWATGLHPRSLDDFLDVCTPEQRDAMARKFGDLRFTPLARAVRQGDVYAVERILRLPAYQEHGWADSDERAICGCSKRIPPAALPAIAQLLRQFDSADTARELNAANAYIDLVG